MSALIRMISGLERRVRLPSDVINGSELGLGGIEAAVAGVLTGISAPPCGYSNGSEYYRLVVGDTRHVD